MIRVGKPSKFFTLWVLTPHLHFTSSKISHFFSILKASLGKIFILTYCDVNCTSLFHPRNSTSDPRQFIWGRPQFVAKPRKIQNSNVAHFYVSGREENILIREALKNTICNIIFPRLVGITLWIFLHVKTYIENFNSF